MGSTSPKVKFLSGEHRRERVITVKEQELYLGAAAPLLHDVSVVLFDTGTRPGECHCLRWENINWQHGRNGAVLVTHGKTVAARRSIPMTPRVRFILEARWEFAEKPAYGWVACPDPMRPRQPCQLEETARPCVQGSEC